jgi:hypothetical protein
MQRSDARRPTLRCRTGFVWTSPAGEGRRFAAMLLQTNSYIVPKDKRAEHARLMSRFRQCFKRLGSVFEVYEQTGPGFTGDGGGRFVQIMRFRDRQHQQEVHDLEQQDSVAQQLIADFCRLVNLSYQQQHGLYSAAYYAGILRDRPSDKPELLVHGEHGEHVDDTLAGGAEFEQPPAPVEPLDHLTDAAAEEEFEPYLREESGEYHVDQQIEPVDVGSEGRAPRPERPADRQSSQR